MEIELLRFAAQIAIYCLPLLAVIAGHLAEPYIMRRLGIAEDHQRRIAGIVPVAMFAILGVAGFGIDAAYPEFGKWMAWR